MKAKVRYIIHPDFVISQSDGQEHFIDYIRLIELYRLDPRECVDWRLCTTRGKEDDIHLYPRYDGKYEIPVESKRNP